MRAAYTVSKNILLQRDPQNEFLEKAHIHLHVPEVIIIPLHYYTLTRRGFDCSLIFVRLSLDQTS